MPSVPAPWIRTLSPGCRRAESHPATTVASAQFAEAASSSVSSSGTLMTQVPGVT